jgi:hypothetical protein
VARVVRLVGTGASWWSSRVERRHRTRTRGGRRREALRRRQNPTALEGSLGTAATYEKEEVSDGPEHSTAWMRRRWHGDSRHRSDQPDQNGRAFKGTRLHRVRSACGVDVPRALQQAGLSRGNGH